MVCSFRCDASGHLYLWSAHSGVTPVVTCTCGLLRCDSSDQCSPVPVVCSLSCDSSDQWSPVPVVCSLRCDTSGHLYLWSAHSGVTPVVTCTSGLLRCDSSDQCSPVPVVCSLSCDSSDQWSPVPVVCSLRCDTSGHLYLWSAHSGVTPVVTCTCGLLTQV